MHKEESYASWSLAATEDPKRHLSSRTPIARGKLILVKQAAEGDLGSVYRGCQRPQKGKGELIPRERCIENVKSTEFMCLLSSFNVTENSHRCIAFFATFALRVFVDDNELGEVVLLSAHLCSEIVKRINTTPDEIKPLVLLILVKQLVARCTQTLSGISVLMSVRFFGLPLIVFPSAFCVWADVFQ